MRQRPSAKSPTICPPCLAGREGGGLDPFLMCFVSMQSVCVCTGACVLLTECKKCLRWVGSWLSRLRPASTSYKYASVFPSAVAREARMRRWPPHPHPLQHECAPAFCCVTPGSAPGEEPGPSWKEGIRSPEATSLPLEPGMGFLSPSECYFTTGRAWPEHRKSWVQVQALP